MLVVAAAISVSSSAQAQLSGAAVRIDQLHPASAGSPFVRAEGPHEKFEEGIAYGVRIAGDYQLEPVATVRVQNGNDVGKLFPVKHAALVHIGGALSPVYWLNLELDFPIGVFEEGDDDSTVPGESFDSGKFGIGDVRIGAHFRVISGKALDLSIGARLWAPLGQKDAYLGNGEPSQMRFELTPAIAGEHNFLLYGCTAGIAPLWFAGGDGQRMAISCAAHFKISPAVTLGVEPHFAAFTYAAAGAEDRVAAGLGNSDFAIQFEPLGVATFRIGAFAISFAGGPGLGGAPGTPTARGVLSFSYAARGERIIEDTGGKDTDLDGVPDGYDACPKEAGPKSRRGCPEKRDADGDGIIEGDACPNERGARYDDPEANGCPDRDNDHVADPVDPCPSEPGVGTGGCPKFARYKNGNFVVTPPIVFKGRTASIPKDGRTALVEIIRTMRTNPKIKQVSVVVGTKGAPVKLTDSRAKALLTIFGDQNFDSNRYEVVLDDELKAGKVTIKTIK